MPFLVFANVGTAIAVVGLVGVTFIAVGLMLALKFHHVIEAWALDAMPIWLQDLSVAL